jgi:hypothetical protein
MCELRMILLSWQVLCLCASCQGESQGREASGPGFSEHSQAIFERRMRQVVKMVPDPGTSLDGNEFSGSLCFDDFAGRPVVELRKMYALMPIAWTAMDGQTGCPVHMELLPLDVHLSLLESENRGPLTRRCCYSGYYERREMRPMRRDADVSRH